MPSCAAAAAAMLLALLQLVTLSDVLLLLLLLFAGAAVVQRLMSRGPMIWPVVGILPAVILHVDDAHHWVARALADVGGTFPYRGIWFGRCRGVVTDSPANVEYILRINFENYPKGRYYRERFAELLGAGIFNADGDLWRRQRRAAASEMHSSRFIDFSAACIRRLVADKLVPLLEELSAGGAVVDLQDILLRFTFDNICAAAFGVDPGCLALDLPDVPFAQAFEAATELTLFRFTVPPFVWKTMRALGVGSEKKLKAAVSTVHDFAERTVADRRAELRKVGSLKGRSDLLSRLMEAAEDGHVGYSDEFLKDFCISFILAGRDTSSVGLAWFFWLLSCHPEVEAKILDELKSVIRRRSSAGDQAKFSGDELKQMEYLHAALTESMRLYPPVPIDFKEVVDDDILPDGGHRVWRGDRVLYSMYAMGRRKDAWGGDSEQFRPERWLKGAEGVFAGESAFKYTVFNAGPRLCIGKRFAYTQMKMVAAAVLVRFAVVPSRAQEVKPKLTTTLYMKNGLTVQFKTRPHVVLKYNII